MFGKAEGECMYCRYRFDCPERDRGIACASYKGDGNEVQTQLERHDGDRVVRRYGWERSKNR